MANSVPNYVSNDDLAEIMPVYANNIKAIENVYGSKNLLKNVAYTQTINGIAFTVYDDGSVKANGTASAVAVLDLYINPTLCDEQMILNGCPEGGGSSTYEINYSNNVDNAYRDYGNGTAKFSKFNSSTYPANRVSIVIRSGVTVSNLMFYPMIRDARIKDSTFMPYAMTNQQLTNNKADEDEISAICNVYGSKNLLKTVAYTQTINGVVFTVYADGSVKINGTASATAFLSLGEYKVWDANKYIISGAVDESDISTYTLQIRTESQTGIVYTIGKTARWTVSSGDTNKYTLGIRVNSGATANNVMFYPMIRDARIKDDAYVPYVPTNKDLVSWAANSLLGVHNLFNPDYLKTTGATTCTITNSGKNIRVQSSSTGQYRNVTWYVAVKAGTQYKLRTSISRTSGKAVVKIATYGGSTIVETSGITTNKDVELTFNSGSETTIQLSLFVTWSTAEDGDFTFNDLLVSLADDSDTSYQPYAMTNKELTDDSAAICNVYGSKNLLKNLAYTRTINGQTFTVNEDGSVTINGTPTADTWLTLNGSITLDVGDYIISAEGSTRSGELWYSVAGQSAGSDIPLGGYLLHVSARTTYRVMMHSRTNESSTNKTIKPMIRDARIKDDTYVPYAPTNRDLVPWVANGMLGAKNLHMFPYTAKSGNINGVDFTVNDDGTILLNGTSSSTGAIVLHKRTGTTPIDDHPIILPKGRYKVSKGGNDCRFDVFYTGSGGSAVDLVAMSISDTVATFELSADTQISTRIGIDARTYSNVLVKPMIYIDADTDATYQKPSMTNQQLSERASGAFIKNSGTVSGTSIKIKGTINNATQYYLVMGQGDSRRRILSFVSTHSNTTEALITSLAESVTVASYDQSTKEVTLTSPVNVQNFTVISNADFTI